MSLSPEAIIGLVALFIAGAPTLVYILRFLRRRSFHRSTQDIALRPASNSRMHAPTNTLESRLEAGLLFYDFPFAGCISQRETP
ncbi:hypothetical protein B0J14DRAFT_706686 [Halenospora varia]|nr:hypothetical protein B0J14DRAFT_706686 [Halenospora varia]